LSVKLIELWGERGFLFSLTFNRIDYYL
jgi:hypothetical protein